MQLFFPIVIFAQSMQLTLKSAGQNGNVAAAYIPAAARRCEGMNCDDEKQTLPRGACWGQAPVCASVSPTRGCQRSGGNLLSWCHRRGKDGGFWGNCKRDFHWEGGRELALVMQCSQGSRIAPPGRGATAPELLPSPLRPWRPAASPAPNRSVSKGEKRALPQGRQVLTGP